ncbi:hypothetical protein [Enterovibrio norvegicus]|uniref:hypothetical protein n=1 Tax=Enterovibrio norvegicus TaxID=188144 RepID=UPI00352BF46B
MKKIINAVASFVRSVKAKLSEKKAAVSAVVATSVAVPMTSQAGSGGQAFDDLYTDLVEMANGSPGKILAFLCIAGVLVFSVVRPNLVGLGASILIMLVLAKVASIIDAMLGAGLPMV